MKKSEAPSRAELLAHQRYLENLASHLAVDPEEAADVVQETWLRALQKPPRHRANLRSWLRRVASNTLYRRHDRRERSADAERDLIVPHSADTTDSVAARRELLQRVQASAAQLDEPYRSVIRLRYFEELSPSEIAQRLGRPLHTVNNQLHRGRERLRIGLDEYHEGNRAVWVPLALPWGRDALATGTGAPGRDARKRGEASRAPSSGPSWRAAGLALAILASALLILEIASSDGSAAPGGPIDVALGGSPAPVVQAQGPAETRRPLATARSASLERPPDSVGRIDLHVVDSLDRPIVAARVRILSREFDAERTRAEANEARSGMSMLGGSSDFRTDERGRVSIPVFARNRLSLRQFASGEKYAVLHVTSPGYADPDLHCVPLPDGGTRDVQVALDERAHEARIRVEDADGFPLRAEVSIWRAPTGTSLEQTDDVRRLPLPRQDPTDEDGRYVHPNLAEGRHQLTVVAPGHARHQSTIEVGALAPTEERVVLARAMVLTGRVTTDDGSPVRDAEVWAEIGVGNDRTLPRTRSDEDGRFRLEGPRGEEAWVFARHPEQTHLVALRPISFSSTSFESVWDPVLAARRELVVEVRDGEGAPLAGATVFLRLVPRELPPWYRMIQTDERGRIRIHDGPEKPLTAEIFLSTGELYRGAMPVVSVAFSHPAGEEIIATVPPESTRFATLAGYLGAADGAPARGVRIFVRGATRRIFHRTGETDATGVFQCEQLPTGDYDLLAQVRGTGMLRLDSFAIEGGVDQERDFFLPTPTTVTLTGSLAAGLGGDSYELIHDLDFGATSLSLPVASGAWPVQAAWNLFPGSFRLRVLEADRLVEERSFDVPSNAPSAGSIDGSITVSLELEPESPTERP